MRKRLATIATAGVLGVGGLTSTYVLAPAVVAAATGDVTASDAVSSRVQHLRDALQSLVDDGTLTDAQADAVAETLAERGPMPGPGHHGLGPGVQISAAAGVLGMTVDELLGELREGQTLAGIAEERGVAKQDLVDELVATAEKVIDDAVADDRLSEARAEQLKAGLLQHVTAHVEGRVVGPPGGRFHHGPRPGRSDAPGVHAPTTELDRDASV